MTTKKSTSKLSIEDKYKLYEAAVQAPEFEVEFLTNTFKKLYGKRPKTLREDFCGTGYLCCEWAKDHEENLALGIDLDPEPVELGKKKHFSKLNEDAQKRVEYRLTNVLDPHKEKADIVAALNFSYFIFKKRNDLLNYFKNVRGSINKEGIFILDIFGGTQCHSPIEDEVEHDNFTYFWDLDKFNPINHECLYKIHFKKNGDKKKYEDVFVYDWRMWGLQEITELLEESGFSNVDVYWEEDDDEGEGTGDFYISKEEENCESWVCYIVARP